MTTPAPPRLWPLDYPENDPRWVTLDEAVRLCRTGEATLRLMATDRFLMTTTDPNGTLWFEFRDLWAHELVDPLYLHATYAGVRAAHAARRASSATR